MKFICVVNYKYVHIFGSLLEVSTFVWVTEELGTQKTSKISHCRIPVLVIKDLNQNHFQIRKKNFHSRRWTKSRVLQWGRGPGSWAPHRCRVTSWNLRPSRHRLWPDPEMSSLYPTSPGKHLQSQVGSLSPSRSLSEEHTQKAPAPSQWSRQTLLWETPWLIIVLTACLIEKTSLDFVTLTLVRSVLTDEVPAIPRLCKLSRWLVLRVLAELNKILHLLFQKVSGRRWAFHFRNTPSLDTTDQQRTWGKTIFIWHF